MVSVAVCAMISAGEEDAGNVSAFVQLVPMARAWMSPGDLVDFLAWEGSVGDTQAMVAA